MVKIRLPMQETQEMWVRYPGQEDPLEEEIETHSSVPACKILWTEEPGRLQSTGLHRVGHVTEHTCTQNSLWQGV